MFVPIIPWLEQSKPKKFLCRVFGCDLKFVRGERVAGMMFCSEALSMDYECKRCGRESSSVTETFDLKLEVKK